jgi:putative tricarboxylic transport membrane protein
VAVADECVPPHGGVTNDRVAGCALMALGLFGAWQSLAFPLGSTAEPGPGFLPLVLALVVFAFGLLVAIRGGHAPAFTRERFRGAGKVAAILGGLVFVALAMEWLGFRATIVVLLVYCLGVIERKPLLVTAGLAFGMAFGSYYLFATLLQVPLPNGALGF